MPPRLPALIQTDPLPNNALAYFELCRRANRHIRFSRLTLRLGVLSGCGSTAMTASEYQKRAQECLDLAQTVPPRIRTTLLEIAKAWMLLADDALDREEPLDVAKTHRPRSRCSRPPQLAVRSREQNCT